MLKPFKTIDDFVKATGFKVGDVITLHSKHMKEIEPANQYLITGFTYDTFIDLGAHTFSLAKLYDKYLYMDRNGDFVPFATKVKEKAKFSTGITYKCKKSDGIHKLHVLSKFISTADNDTYLTALLDNKSSIMVLLVRDELDTDSNNNEEYVHFSLDNNTWFMFTAEDKAND